MPGLTLLFQDYRAIFVSHIFNSESTQELKVTLSYLQRCRVECPSSIAVAFLEKNSTDDRSKVITSIAVSIGLDLGSVNAMGNVMLTFMPLKQLLECGELLFEIDASAALSQPRS